MKPLPATRPHGPRRLLPARLRGSLGAVLGIGLLLPLPFSAAEGARRNFEIPAGDAATTLKHFAAQAGEQLLYSPDDVSGIRTHAVQGEFAPLVALNRMLERTPLRARQDATTRAIAITAAKPPRGPPTGDTRSTREDPRPTPDTPLSSPLPSHSETQVMKKRNFLSVLTGILSLGLAQTQTPGANDATSAASRTHGTIEGRVLNVGRGGYVERARITVEGTLLEAFTDADGRYRLPAVPAGEVRLRAFFTGLRERSDTVKLNAGQVLVHDFEMDTTAGSHGNEPLKLSQFVVAEAREMDGAAIAINEQRFSSNIKTVVAADEFGPVVDDNVGEILKFLPGITATFGEGSVRYVSINGVPNTSVPVTMDGFDVSSAQPGTNRGVDLIFASTANLSRLEVITSPTPESPGTALAGSVNMVQRSAFERSKPAFSGSAYLLARDKTMTFDRLPGLDDKPKRKIMPGYEFSYSAPVNDRFGYSVAASWVQTYLPSLQLQTGWRGARLVTNGVALPDTAPEAPYLSDFQLRDFQAESIRASAGATFDFKVSAASRLSLSFKYVYFYAISRAYDLNFLVNRVAPGNFGPTFTQGAVGAGELTNNITQVQVRHSKAYMPTLSYRHNGPVWKAEAGVGLSLSDTLLADASEVDAWGSVTTRRTGLTIRFDEIRPRGPGRITVTDGATGAAVDPYRIDTFALTGATTRGFHRDTGQWGDFITDSKGTAYVNAQRDFDGGIPFTLKSGLDLRRSTRDLRGGRFSYTFVGADGLPSTSPAGASDDSAAVVRDATGPSNRAGRVGFPQVEYISPERLWELNQRNPAYFTTNENANLRAERNFSKYAEEIVSAAYVRGDLQLLRGRLKLVGGLRFEQTNVKAQGPLTDLTLNYRRDNQGNVILGANGRPQPIASDPLEVSRLTLLDRGASVRKEYLRPLPSINASYNLRDDLIARFAYYQSLGRPDFNQYAGGLTVPDTESPPSPTNRITVNNAAIKAWSAQTAKVTLEHYFKGVGVVSVSGFQRDFENFFGATVFQPSPEFLSLYGLDPATYGAYDVATQHNIASKVRMRGVDVNYKQSLTFLPGWARGIQVFANGSILRATGDASANFSGYIPRTANWGVSLSRPRFSVKLNWNYYSTARTNQITGRSIQPGTYNYTLAQTRMEATGEYRFRGGISAFLNIRDLTSAPEGIQTYGPATPDYARQNTYKNYQALWTGGVRYAF